MPSESWPPIGFSCSAENQPGSGADIELWVAGSTTSVSGRSQSRESPSHAPAAGAAVVVPPDPRKIAIAPPITATAITDDASRRERRPDPVRRAPAARGAGAGMSRSRALNPP